MSNSSIVHLPVQLGGQRLFLAVNYLDDVDLPAEMTGEMMDDKRAFPGAASLTYASPSRQWRHVLLRDITYFYLFQILKFRVNCHYFGVVLIGIILKRQQQ